MNRTIIVIIVIVLAFGGSYLCKRALHTEGRPLALSQNPSPEKGSSHRQCRRIVSLAPSITETLFALGLGDRVVAVTRYCEYPVEARTIMKVGGYYDANYEAIMALSPDLVIMLPEQEKQRQFLENAGFEVLVVNNKTIPDILGTIKAVGERCDVTERSRILNADLESRMDRVRRGAETAFRPRVMVSIGGNMGNGSNDNFCVAGPKSFYDQMVTLAGGVNAYQGHLAFPEVSKEGLIELNPHVIIDIAVNTDYQVMSQSTRTTILKTWTEAASGTDAARDNRIYLFEKDYMVIPGPRFILALEDIARKIHPEKEARQ
jgi:iron complex transport system substrate-binding protein